MITWRIRSRTLLLSTVGLLLLLPVVVSAQEGCDTTSGAAPGRGMKRVGSRGTLLPLTSIEWGVPDRWSFTSRYIHELNEKRGEPVQHGLCLSVSPGTAGGRLGASYYTLIVPEGKEYAYFFECRAVVLRTWGSPLETGPDRTLVGGELRGSLMPLCNIGVGLYWQVSPADGSPEPIVGMHFGLGM